MATPSRVIEQWKHSVAELVLAPASTAVDSGSSNEVVLSLAPVRSSEIATQQLTEFLAFAYTTIAQKAANIGQKGLFYAWLDEPSGTLRLSFALAQSASELPFGCQIELLDSPSLLASACVETAYKDGIPFSELPEVAFVDEDPSQGDEYVLPVFAKAVLPSG